MNIAPFTLGEIIKATGGSLFSGEEGLSVEGVSTDSRYIAEDNLFIAIKGDRFDGHDFIPTVLEKGVPAIVISEKACLERIGLTDSVGVVIVPDTIKAYQSIARFHRRRFQIPVVGITGTNGKSTTKEMTAAILSRRYRTVRNEGNYNNHIGVPRTLLSLSEGDEILITEMGMNAPGEIATLCGIAEPTIGVVTNVSMGHLEGLGSIEAVRKAKGELVRYLDGRGGTAILNADDKNAISLAEGFKGKVITFGIKEKGDIKAEDISSVGGRYSFTLKVGEESIGVGLKSIGYHDIYNALAAASVGVALGIGLDEIGKGLADYTPLAMRMEVINIGGVEIINDAYNANPASMDMAIATLNGINSRGRKVLVAGDMLELGSESINAHMDLGRKVASSMGIDRFCTYGKLAAIAAESAIDSGMEADLVISSNSHKDIVAFLDGYLREGDILLVKGSRGNRLEEVIRGLSDIRGDK